MSELDQHRIARIEIVELHSRYPRTIGKNARRGTHGSGYPSPAVIVHTDHGAVGWGLLRLPDADLSRLLGRRIADVFDPEQGVIADEAHPLDFALHDLAGVILNRPVFELLGAAGSRAMTVYDGAIYLDDLDPEDAPRGIDVVLQNCASDYAMGYRAFKLKIGRGYQWAEAAEGLERDITVTRTVREHYPDCPILVDANDGYTDETILNYLDGVLDYNIFWVEEPFPETRSGLERFRNYLKEHSPHTLIADGEAHPNIPFLLDLAGEGLIDVLLMDIMQIGLTSWRQVMPRLLEIGAQASPHAWGDPLKTLYAAQVSAGLGNVVTVEGVPGTVDGIDCSNYRFADGILTVPDLPGWGIAPPTSNIRLVAG